MRVTAQELVAKGVRGRVVDLDTGRAVRKVLWFDSDPVPPLGPGIWLLEALKVGADGRAIRDRDGNCLTDVMKVRGKFTVDVPVVGGVQDGSPRCARCTSTMTLPGDDLCAPCRARDRGQKNPMRVEAVDDPFSPHACIRCGRQATWCVSDQVAVTAAQCGFRTVTRGGHIVIVPDRTIGGKQQWARAALVGRRYWCDRCFKPPRLLDADGEPIKDLETTNRPD